MLDIWYSLSPLALTPTLSDEERQRRDQFVDAAASKRYENAHALKRLVLAQYGTGCAPLDLNFTRGRYGKPEVAEPFPYRFNMSHSAACVAIAVAAEEVGVDIEWHRPVVASSSLARCVFNREERGWLLRQSCFDDAFFRLWTLKEALLKAAGTGFSRPPQEACWHGLDGPQASAWYAGRQWVGLCRRIGPATLAVAVSVDCPIGHARLLSIDGASDAAAHAAGASALCWTETSWMASQTHFERSGAL
ncbi:4'-phosphopantetheinyl transferase family protein [Paraburkholderia panacisoli]|nr:4'-phosphopantetheinyl transferase superfamily protein [Paraburkholderia panacisoli]